MPEEFQWIYPDTAQRCIEIKTNSTIGSGHELDVLMYKTKGGFAMRVNIKFNSEVQYWIASCINPSVKFSGNLPTEVDKVWRIVSTSFLSRRVQIYCNDVEVVNIRASEDTCDDSAWKEWADEVIEGWGSMFFGSTDTASDYFRSCRPSNMRLQFFLREGFFMMYK